MFSHIMLGADDLDAAKTFYDAALGALDIPPGVIGGTSRLIYIHDGGRFILTHPINGQPASCANGGTTGFRAASTDAVDAWHAAGVAHGGASCEDPPGIRETGVGKLYLAYLRDPSGNKLCAVHPIAANA
jgi:catechol 2,3-dioxygenase-like lactoylglutathione lyase family enzyme